MLETPPEPTEPPEPTLTVPRAKAKLALIEAALYVTGKPLDLKTLGSVVGFRSEDKVKELARTLKDKYGKDESSLEVLELSDGRFVMQLKPQYVRHVKRLATRQHHSRPNEDAILYRLQATCHSILPCKGQREPNLLTR